jgi:hypothetical protein
MTQGRIVQAIMAGSCLISGSICVAANFIVAAVITSTLHSGNPRIAFGVHFAYTSAISIVGGVFLFAGFMLGITLLRRASPSE